MSDVLSSQKPTGLATLLNFNRPASTTEGIVETQLTKEEKGKALMLFEASTKEDDAASDDDADFARRYRKMMWKAADHQNEVEDEYDDTLDQFGLSVPAGEQEEELDDQEKQCGRNKLRVGRLRRSLFNSIYVALPLQRL